MTEINSQLPRWPEALSRTSADFGKKKFQIEGPDGPQPSYSLLEITAELRPSVEPH